MNGKEGHPLLQQAKMMSSNWQDFKASLTLQLRHPGWAARKTIQPVQSHFATPQQREPFVDVLQQWR
jgi:hypothetical protein